MHAARTRPWARVLSALACGWTLNGVWLLGETLPVGPNPRCFGHGGWGGSLGIVDLDARLSWSYVMNKMSPGTLGDTRGSSLAAALYAAL